MSLGSELGGDLRARAARHVRDILALAIEHDPGEAALVVYDRRSALAQLLTHAYRVALPRARFLDFDAHAAPAILAEFESVAPRSLVVLIQSMSFRLDQFRIRLELFKRGLKVIEHPHLERMSDDDVERYVDALAYDPQYYRGVGGALKQRIDCAARAVVTSGPEQLVFDAGLEPAKLNVGDYRELKDVGGQFPIGEVFTEARELTSVAGRVRIAYFGDANFEVNRPPLPITLVVDAGRVVAALDASEEFSSVLETIRADEGEIWLREFGMGLNRAFSLERTVRDIGTFERMCGVHFSLGSKHASYAKPQIQKRKARHHVDVFAMADEVRLDDVVVYRDGAWFPN